MSPSAVPLKLDMQYPDTAAGNRPAMFIHGGGRDQTKPEIVAMANYYAREDGCLPPSMPTRNCVTQKRWRHAKVTNSPCPGWTTSLPMYRYRRERIEYLIEQQPGSIGALQQGIAQYPAQRDAGAALRWLTNASTYKVNTDYITVGGASPAP